MNLICWNLFNRLSSAEVCKFQSRFILLENVFILARSWLEHCYPHTQTTKRNAFWIPYWEFCFYCRSSDYGSTYERLNDKVGVKTVLSYLYVCPTNKRKVRRLQPLVLCFLPFERLHVPLLQIKLVIWNISLFFCFPAAYKIY